MIYSSSVELLIGNDYYLDIILPQKIEVQAGILSGRTSEITNETSEASNESILTTPLESENFLGHTII